MLPSTASLQGAAGIGALNVFPDRDGHVRRVPLLVQMGETPYPSLVAELLRLTLPTCTRKPWRSSWPARIPGSRRGRAPPS
ncbi:MULTISPECIES: CHASE2 domain-containing protein [unclassified Thiocapsa]|uniref:CHASE2 domain-containing protein n=1 Tax=unclassified Thiocapsa TaxID=2641286 RepID=UPI0035B3B9D0